MATVAAVMSTNEEPTTDRAASKGRKRKAAEAEIDEKPRGRPRKNSKDESAAERRRTQIRLAQRAYRQRKETTIDELRQRVSELTTTIEMMNKTLHDFAHSATQRGLPDQTRTELEDMVEKIAPIVTTARNPSKFPQMPDTELMQNLSAVTVDPMNGSYNDVTTSPDQEEHVDIGMGYSYMSNGQDSAARGNTVQDYQQRLAKSQRTMLPMTTHAARQDYQAPHPQPIFGPSVVDCRQAELKREPPSEDQQQVDAHVNHIAQPFLDTSNYETSLVPRSYSVSPASSYSQFEKSFSRRLQRRCIETGWELLTNPDRAPQTFNRVFRLTSFLGGNHTALVQAWSQALRRTINDTLDSVISPLSHVGGAGLHYPDDRTGCRRAPTRTEKGFQLDQLASSTPGFEGEWLDPNDVQGYLHSRGIKVDGSASFIHARLPISYLNTPARFINIDAYMNSLHPSGHAIEEAEEFHRRFGNALNPTLAQHNSSPATATATATATSASVPRASSHDLQRLGLWGPEMQNIDLGSLTDLIESPALNFYTVPGTASYNASASANANASPPLAAAAAAAAAGDISGLLHRHPPPPHHANDASSGTSSASDRDRSGSSSSGTGGGGSGSRGDGSVSSASSVECQVTTLNVTLEVAKLMKGLLLGSVCLGRAPGFRRELVDAAVRASVVISF